MIPEHIQHDILLALYAILAVISYRFGYPMIGTVATLYALLNFVLSMRASYRAALRKRASRQVIQS
jgi:bacteriorhodopsin